MSHRSPFLIPPNYCQYSNGTCDQKMDSDTQLKAFFVYPSNPQNLANTIKECVKNLQTYTSSDQYKTWENLKTSGLIIFCEICKNIRAADYIVANITSLNFNVLFEIGYAIGLHKPILPVKDKSIVQDNKIFNEIGFFDTIGYKNFSNNKELTSIISKNEQFMAPIGLAPEINRNQPIYYIKSPIDIDGSIKLYSFLKKCAFKFRTFDSREISRLSFHEAYKQVMSSITVIAHLMDPSRDVALTHNARAAFVCGMAMAAGKHVLMLQEQIHIQPIDYRDIVIPYTDANSIPGLVESIIQITAETLTSIKSINVQLPKKFLEKIDLGDIAAENEIQYLGDYFVKTPQFQQVQQGHARIVVGRKGSGKTALFYGFRNQFNFRKDKFILDLKPEGHQFIRLREMVLSNLSKGLQEHTVIAFWHYLILLEIIGKILKRDIKLAYKDDETLKNYRELENIYKEYSEIEGDFSERLMKLINKIIYNFPKKPLEDLSTQDLTNSIYQTDINKLNKAIIDRLHKSEGVWILFDNIDKGFPSYGLNDEDILIVRCLLEATRKIQNNLQAKHIDCNTTIFIRSDVYNYLIDTTSDRGKESTANLDWSDLVLIKELLSKRFKFAVPELDVEFDEAWSRIFETHVAGESSFNYITDRTFLRPRDILNFIRKCIQIAVSRNHEKVEKDDIKQAEKEFSEDMFNELIYEMRDIFQDMPDVLSEFLGFTNKLSKEDIFLIFENAKVKSSDFEKVLDKLLWFSFLGISIDEEEYFTYKMQYNLLKLTA